MLNLLENSVKTPPSTPPPNQAISETIPYEIVHQISGRLRLRIPHLAGNIDYGKRLQRLLLKTKIITENRINTDASCLIVSYQSETVSESVIRDYLHLAIQAASQEKESGAIVRETAKNEAWQSVGLPAVTLALAIAASPLELPFVIVGSCILFAATPLWQQVIQGITNRGEITVDSLDALWLTAQLIQGNGIAGALALNFAGMGETLRQGKLAQLEQELYVLFEEEDEAIHWLWKEKRFTPLKLADKENWVQSVEETELMQQVKPLAQGAILPTLLLSIVAGILTNDLGPASALLPLDLGVSLRGVTPLAVVSALIAAAHSGVYIRQGRTLEHLAQVDTLVFTAESLGNVDKVGNFSQFDVYIVATDGGERLEEVALNWGINSDRLHIAANPEEINSLISQLQYQGRKVAWIDNNTSNLLTATCADVVISLAKGNYESQADVILHHNDLQTLFYSLNLAKHTLSTAYQSLAIAIVPNLVTVGVGVFWGLNPIIAVLINGGSAILAEINSLRPLGEEYRTELFS